MLQLDKAEDFVLATGETHTVREFTEVAFAELGIELEWQGENENEKGIVSAIKNEKLEICHSGLRFGISIIQSPNHPI